MKYIRKKGLFIVILLAFSLFHLKVQASNNYYLTRQNYENIYYVQNGLPDFYGSDIQSKFVINQTTAFCVDPGVSIKTDFYDSILLSESKFNNEIQKQLNLIVYYGYDYPNHQTDKYYMATQALIWETVSNYKTEFYTERYGYGNYIDVEKEKQEILFLISNHYKIPNFTNQNYTYSLVDYLEYEDELLKNYEIIDSNWKHLKIEDNKLKIENLNNYAGTINISLKRKSYRSDVAQYYFQPESQSLITGGIPEDLITSFSITIKGGKLKVNKVDYESKKLIKNNKIKFNIRNNVTNEYIYFNGSKDIYINNDGYFITDLLPYGEYEITEVSTIEEYYLNPNSKIVTIHDSTISNDNVVEIDFYNKLKKTNIELNKIDSESKQPISGVEFTLYAKEDIITSDGTIHYKKNQIIKKDMTNDKGIIIFEDLIYGNYYIKETKTKEGYIENNNIYDIALYQENNYKFVVENKFKKGNLKINKLDVDSKLFIKDTNIKFNIINKETNEYIYVNNTKDLSINEAGFLIINDLPYGEYEIIEVSTIKEYSLNSNSKIVTINDSTISNDNVVEIDFYNQLKKTNIELNKIDSESKQPISGVEFTLCAKEDIITSDGTIHYKKDQIIKKDITNDKGIIIFEDLIYGNYYIKETKTKEGYIENNNIYDIALYQENNYKIIVENKLKKGSIKIKKYGEVFNYSTLEYSFEPLENVEFILYAKEDIISKDNTIHYKKNEVIKRITTNAEGVLEFNDLVLGKYCLLETKTKENYIIDKTEQCFDLYDKNDIFVNVKNYLEKSTLKIKKIDSENHEPLKDVKFEIYYNNQSLGIYMTNELGIIEIKNMPINIYQIKEIQTNINYHIDKNIHEINLSTNNEIIIKNQKKIIVPNTLDNNYLLYFSYIYLGIYLCYAFVKKIL